MDFLPKHLRLIAASWVIIIAPIAQVKADSHEAVELEEFVVTGSYISRPELDSIAPVVIIDRETIERSGAVTISEYFQKNIFTTAGVINEFFTQGTAPASSGIDLRGLGLSRTLVLLDGRRLPVFPFGQSKIGTGNNDSFVDINLIPLGAIERIEILKDGASALYGADAVAGVVNLITRKDYHGVLLSGQYGGTLKGDGEEGQFNLLAGYSTESTNLTFALDYLNRSQIMSRSRDISRSANGVIDDRSAAGNPGTIVHIAGDGSLEPDPRCPLNRRVDGFCKFDFAPYTTLIPETERTGLMLSFEHQFNENIGVFARGTYSHSESERDLAPSTGFFVTDGSAFAEPVVGVIYRLTELGPRVDQFKTDAYNILAGIDGKFKSWDFELAFGTGYIRSKITGISGYARESLVNAQIANGSLNLLGSSPNFRPSSVNYQTERLGKSRIYTVDFRANGDVIEMPFGVLKMAFGAEYRKEEFSDQFDEATAAGEVIGIGGTSGEGDRDVGSMYLELAIPIWEYLDLQLAGRWDHYSDFGDTFNPKMSLRWQPFDNLTFRANIGTGFKAPALHELYSGDIRASESIYDPKTGKVKEVDFFSSGNSDLDAEESTSWGFGLSWDVIDQWNVTADYWHIINENAVISSPQFYVNNEGRFPENVIRNSSGNISSVLSPFNNVAEQRMWGFDLSSSFKWDFEQFGQLLLKAGANYLGSFQQSPAPGEAFEELSGRDGYPRWRSQGTVVWQKSDYEASVTVNYIDGYERLDSDSKIASWTTFDIQAVWQPSFLPGNTLKLGVDNLFNKAPPEDPNFEGWPFFNRALHNPRGRFLYVRYQYQF